MAESYAHVAVSASGVVPAPIEAVWSLVRVFSSIGQWMVQDGFVSFTSELLPGHLEGQIGSCRIMTLDGQSFVEQLEGLDDIKHILRWKLISHPDAVNPWPYAFLNFQGRMQLRPVSLTNETFLEYDGNFDTEWPGVEEMERSLLAQITGGVKGLQKVFAKPPTIGLAPAKPASSNGAAIGATNVPAYRGQTPGLYSHQTPNPQTYMEQAYAPPGQGYAGYQSGYSGGSYAAPAYQPPEREDLGMPPSVPSMQQGGPEGEAAALGGPLRNGSQQSLSDYRPSDAGRRKQDSGGTDISSRSELARDAPSPTGRLPRVSQRAARAKNVSGYSST